MNCQKCVLRGPVKRFRVVTRGGRRISMTSQQAEHASGTRQQRRGSGDLRCGGGSCAQGAKVEAGGIK